MDMGMATGGGLDLDELKVLAMSPGGSAASAAAAGSEDEADLRRGPWTVEEDLLLVNYIAAHGEGRWNSLARSAGLKRTGKSCRLRWLNYLRPDVRRGNITAAEQLLILELHSRWGNRWSKIAQHLPGRTDNEIKNYWRTRVQKHAKQLRCDVNSRHFRDVVRRVWMPRLVERIQAESSGAGAGAGAGAAAEGGGQAQAAAAPAVAPASTTASAPAAYHLGPYGGHRQSADVVVPPNGYADADYYSYSEPGQAAAPAAMSPDNTSSALRSTLTDASHAAQQHHYATSAATPTNEGCGVGGKAAGPMMDGDGVVQEEDEDVFAGTRSELLATAGRDDDSNSKIGLPDFELGDFEMWSLEDLCLQQLC
ncbi:transcription factor MYB2-like [Panicum virgatum]|uniref:Uncharacterized protein n=1 Tax=Panicum virgatum TaxID=38727 RepID=A0A8T0U3H0_PANVG|nr:transcription factor MYB2-like [Panicum virgatum]KAG2616215.1 hypothetical protein PVAP13_3NG182139 [Panicum virgatum]